MRFSSISRSTTSSSLSLLSSSKEKRGKFYSKVFRRNFHVFVYFNNIESCCRLKIFQILEAVDDNSLAIAINDPSAVEFIQDCLSLVQSTSMEWLLPDACTDNLQILETIENKTLSDAEEIEEIIVRDAFNLLRRIYQSTASCFGSQTIEKVK